MRLAGGKVEAQETISSISNRSPRKKQGRNASKNATNITAVYTSSPNRTPGSYAKKSFNTSLSCSRLASDLKLNLGIKLAAGGAHLAAWSRPKPIHQNRGFPRNGHSNIQLHQNQPLTKWVRSFFFFGIVTWLDLIELRNKKMSPFQIWWVKLRSQRGPHYYWYNDIKYSGMIGGTSHVLGHWGLGPLLVYMWIVWLA